MVEPEKPFTLPEGSFMVSAIYPFVDNNQDKDELKFKKDGDVPVYAVYPRVIIPWGKKEKEDV